MLDDGLLNWFESTGSIQFQGKSAGKARLESAVPALLYPQEGIAPPSSISTHPASAPSTAIRLEETKSLSIERQYLTSGVNDGELIVGIVSAVGTQSNRVIEPLKDRLQGFGYVVEEIRVSSILPPFNSSAQARVNEYERIKHYMAAGDKLREASANNAILAAGVIQQISQKRDSTQGKKA